MYCTQLYCHVSYCSANVLLPLFSPPSLDTNVISIHPHTVTRFSNL